MKAIRIAAIALAVGMLCASCTESDDGDAASTTEDDPAAPSTTAVPLDLVELGLWDDGPCDESRPPLVLGLTTAFETEAVAGLDQALALEASAVAFNERGGANGACIQVHTCDDGALFDQAIGCVGELDDAGVVATVNDQSTEGGVEVSQLFAEAGIPRVASNVTNSDWGDPNAYPLDASGTGVTFLMPQGLIDAGSSSVGIIRVNLAAASALIGLLGDLYDDRGATFVADLPVAAGTTDYSQFILAAEDSGADSIALAISQAQAIQVVRAAEQLSSDLRIGASLGSLSYEDVAALGEIADQMVFVWPFPPATFDLPVYGALRADLAASGEDVLQPRQLRASAMRSWIGLYALLRMIRDDGMTEFTRPAISALLNEAVDVPMLGIFGDESWTPSTNHPGLWQRAGTNRWATWSWDPEATFEGSDGGFVLASEFDFDDVMCGSPFGAPEPC
jgi:branched-chain amino acid transport system substrate-binding protein